MFVFSTLSGSYGLVATLVQEKRLKKKKKLNTHQQNLSGGGTAGSLQHS
jgi:hypothetical protein